MSATPIEICKGCGNNFSLRAAALSRYRHGDICDRCGTLEAFYGDFIEKYRGDNVAPAVVLSYLTR